MKTTEELFKELSVLCSETTGCNLQMIWRKNTQEWRIYFGWKKEVCDPDIREVIIKGIDYIKSRRSLMPSKPKRYTFY